MAVRGRCGRAIAAEEHYARFERFGVTYGGGLRSVERVWFGADEALGRVRVAVDAGAPALLDGCLQVAMALVLVRAAAAAIPTALGAVRLDGAAPAEVWVHARSRGDATEVTIFDDAGRVVGELAGLQCVAMAGAVDPLADCAYQVVWRRRLLATAEPARPVSGDAGWTSAESGARPVSGDAGGAGRSSAEPGAWVVIGDAGGVGAALAAGLQRRGASCRVI